MASITLETKMCYGPPCTTVNHHNETGWQGPMPDNITVIANAVFQRYELTVSVEEGWHFTGNPFVNCVTNDQGAFEWNNFPIAHDRFFITQSTPRFIRATCWAGSRSITINLACVATKE
nr:hypothetical protein [Mucilaginibacter sp. L294]